MASVGLSNRLENVKDTNHPTDRLSSSSRKKIATALFWLQGFVLWQIACQLILVANLPGSLRTLVRVASFAGSLALLVLPGKGAQHPAAPWLAGAIIICGINMVHPTTNSVLAAVAQITLYLAIVAPMFWAGRMLVTPKILKRVVLLYWGFQTLSASFGVLQVYYPERFQPDKIEAFGNNRRADKLKITLASGEEVWRPMGLNGIPGGAAIAGLYA